MVVLYPKNKGRVNKSQVLFLKMALKASQRSHLMILLQWCVLCRHVELPVAWDNDTELLSAWCSATAFPLVCRKKLSPAGTWRLQEALQSHWPRCLSTLSVCVKLQCWYDTAFVGFGLLRVNIAQEYWQLSWRGTQAGGWRRKWFQSSWEVKDEIGGDQHNVLVKGWHTQSKEN